ncbi:hypothetical protein O181_107754 [Austropuccinia psidii MF-1]|uniref:Uncharacterized protein n=1 Tax=Austropuccinia psidii MF-1 TaxID=1389203 RepID=A0A9Q3PNA8_9BASI|nr:hypothetical protein [Austropuccinia psidii MF-1]
MEDIITRKRIGKTWTRNPVDSKIMPKTSREDRRAERPFIKGNKCVSTFYLAKTCTEKSKTNAFQVIEEAQCTEGKEESDQDSEISEDTPGEDCHI